MRRVIFLRRVTLTALLLLGLSLLPARGQESWQVEFDETCGKTDEAMALSVPELSRLLERCDRLQGVISGQEETVRKVYLKRLEMCRNLYRFVLESKQGKQGQPE